VGGNSVINLLCLGIQGMEALLQETYTLKTCTNLKKRRFLLNSLLLEPPTFVIFLLLKNFRLTKSPCEVVSSRMN